MKTLYFSVCGMKLKMINKTKNTIFLAVLYVFLGVIWLGVVYGATNDFKVDLISTIDIEKNGRANVTYNFKVTNLTESKIPKTFQFLGFGDEISDLVAKTDDGATLDSRYDTDSKLFTINLPPAKSGKGKVWTFTVKFQTKLLKDFGMTKVAQIPPLEGSTFAISSEQKRVLADLGLGFAISRGPEPDSANISVGKQVVSYSNKSGQFDKSILLLFGEGAVAQVKINTELVNNSFWWKTFEVTLPPDTSQQQTLVDSLMPQPDNVNLDADGNIIALYRVGPKKKKVVEATALINLYPLNYDFSKALPLSEVDNLLIDRYTRLTQYWQPIGVDYEIKSDQPIDGQLKQLTYQVIEKFNDISLDSVSLKERTNALAISDRLVGELRLRKIPARVVVGKVFSDGKHLLDSPQNHAWVEAFVAGVGWVTIDPVFLMTSDYFGVTDVIRVGLALWGIEDDRPPVALDDTRIEFNPDLSFEPPAGEATVKAVKHMIFPGFAIYEVKAVNEPGYIKDNMSLILDGEHFALGSMAPLQTSSVRLVQFGSKAFANEQVQFGIDSDSDRQLDEVFLSTESKVSWTPFISLVGGLIAIITITYLRSRRGGGPTKKSREALLLHDENVGDNIEEIDMLKLERPSVMEQINPNTDTHRATANNNPTPLESRANQNTTNPRTNLNSHKPRLIQ